LQLPEKEEKKEEKEATLTKSSDPHLAGGEKQKHPETMVDRAMEVRRDCRFSYNHGR
jgi:hypothetical protein